mmetsp:Transcript_81198/g.216996  ORF Transcript_81198/g.216996 Transcript_81198/m.216996 type:complete len:85 (-) Transcript_81198:87-341(-)
MPSCPRSLFSLLASEVGLFFASFGVTGSSKLDRITCPMRSAGEDVSCPPDVGVWCLAARRARAGHSRAFSPELWFLDQAVSACF